MIFSGRIVVYTVLMVFPLHRNPGQTPGQKSAEEPGQQSGQKILPKIGRFFFEKQIQNIKHTNILEKSL